MFLDTGRKDWTPDPKESGRGSKTRHGSVADWVWTVKVGQTTDEGEGL